MSYWIVCGICVAVMTAVGCSAVPSGGAEDYEAAARGGEGTKVSADSAGAAKSEFRAVAVRYQVSDVARAVAFYTTHLGFEATQRSGKAFAMVGNGNLTLYLSGPGSSGARAMPDGTVQRPGGWNRVVIEVRDLPARVAVLRRAGLRFRNDIETGPGGRQIQVEDPDGNPIELFEPAT